MQPGVTSSASRALAAGDALRRACSQVRVLVKGLGRGLDLEAATRNGATAGAAGHAATAAKPGPAWIEGRAGQPLSKAPPLPRCGPPQPQPGPHSPADWPTPRRSCRSSRGPDCLLWRPSQFSARPATPPVPTCGAALAAVAARSSVAGRRLWDSSRRGSFPARKLASGMLTPFPHSLLAYSCSTVRFTTTPSTWP